MDSPIQRRCGFTDSEMELVYRALQDSKLYLSPDPVIRNLLSRALAVAKEIASENEERRRIRDIQTQCVADYEAFGRIKDENNRFS